MKSTITFNLRVLNTLKLSVLVLILSIPAIFSAQTVTNVFPTRVTSDTKITIIGTGFTSGTSFSIKGNDIGVDGKTFISSTEMTVTVNYNSTSNRSGSLHIGNVDTGIAIDYVGYSNQRTDNSNNDNTITRIDEIYTTYNGFWRSNDWKNDHSDRPNTSHDLLGFKYGGIVYSTGVNDAWLISNLGTEVDNVPNLEFIPQTFKAYSTNGVTGKTHSANYLAMADLVDNELNEGTAVTSPNILGLTVFDVIVDGVNGLDLGTGIANFNITADIRFFSGNGQVGALDITDPSVEDDAPDLLITQIAQPGSYDVYYYADDLGNVVGTPVRLYMQDEGNGPGLLAEWRLDLYRFNNNVNYDVATPQARSFSNNETRPLRMVALKLEHFGIDASNIDLINNINMVAGGRADIAFLAYNKSAFDIKSPLIEQNPVSRFVCKFPNTSSVTFNAKANIDGGSTAVTPEELEKEALNYEWFTYNTPISGEEGTLEPSVVGANFNVNAGSGITPSDLGTYKVKIYNEYGTVFLPVTLAEGGTPVTWNGTSFSLPPAYTAAELTVDDADRSLNFAADYTSAPNTNLEACDCKVSAGREVTIAAGSTLKLYDELIVEDLIPAFTDIEDNFQPEVPAGIFTLEDNASLIQTKAVSANQNSGLIKMKREASNLHNNDYVYWSSPVQGFNVSNIPGNATYQWDTDASNANGSQGNWVSASNSIMTAGDGYIKRVNSAATFTAQFVGKPNNGVITKSITSVSAVSSEETNWNLIGNPYPSALNVEKFLNANTNIDGNVRIWTHSAAISTTPNPTSNPYYQDFAYNYGDQYITSNGLGSTPDPSFSGNIAAGQAFFVQAESTGNVTFNNAMRYDASENAYDNTDFYRSAETTADTNLEKQLIWLSLVKANNQSSSTLLGYADGATYGKDRLYDSRTNGEEFSIYSLISEEQMIIQGRPLPFVNSDVIPLGVNIDEAGIFEIAIDNLEGNIFVEGEQAIYIEDTYQNTIHNLRQSPYTFTGTVGNTNDRFILRYTNSNDTLSAIDLATTETFAFVKDNVLKVQSTQNIKAITLYDLTGKTIATYSLDRSKPNFETAFNFSRSVYFAVIQLENKTLVKKKLMN
ncbi:hypothetical protein [Sediminibacter sp. Hel_I_10]|uniref:hypothetical protein n=1 Tax=Sediminibacter sp. Hel_I_10 TaxID=1392490 RepID=UPI00047A2B9E|nr:hypothetical protein [Sediminibacter sp. Hel_I_10]